IAVKFFPAIFLLYFFFRRDWKYLFVCLFVVLLCVLVIPAMVIGPSETIQSQLTISEHATAMMRALAMDNIDSQYFASVITRIMYMPITSQFTKILIIAGYLIAASAVYLVYRISEAQIEYSAFWAWGILSATIPFWIPSAWPHYFVYLPFLQVLAYCHISNINLRWRKPAIVLWIFSLTFSSIFITHIVQNWFRYVGFGSLFWSSIFILTVILIILLPNLAKRNTQSCSENFSPSP
ncbi:MAG: glycosyltransferase 87 family protein, partial [Chloroflexota bacterium]